MENSKRWKSSIGSVYNIAYHLIWCPKYRRKVLVGEVELELKAILSEIALERGWEIGQMEIMPDHVHIFLKANPVNSVAEIVNYLKGVSSYALRRKFPRLARLKALWSPSYYCETIGHISEETIKKYIEEQKHK